MNTENKIANQIAQIAQFNELDNHPTDLYLLTLLQRERNKSYDLFKRYVNADLFAEKRIDELEKKIAKLEKRAKWCKGRTNYAWSFEDCQLKIIKAKKDIRAAKKVLKINRQSFEAFKPLHDAIAERYGKTFNKNLKLGAPVPLPYA